MRQSAYRWCLCSTVALSPWRLCYSRGFVLLSVWNYVEITSGVYFNRLAVKVVTLPLLPPRPFRNHHTMPFSSSRGSKASQRCISHGKLSISTDEMATWKTSPNRSPSPSLYLLISHYHPLDFILSLSRPEAECEMHLYYSRLLRRQHVLLSEALDNN